MPVEILTYILQHGIHPFIRWSKEQLFFVGIACTNIAGIVSFMCMKSDSNARLAI